MQIESEATKLKWKYAWYQVRREDSRWSTEIIKWGPYLETRTRKRPQSGRTKFGKVSTQYWQLEIAEGFLCPILEEVRLKRRRKRIIILIINSKKLRADLQYRRQYHLYLTLQHYRSLIYFFVVSRLWQWFSVSFSFRIFD